MTTTSERSRALIWGGQILDQLQVESWIPVDLADRSRALAVSYPKQDVIEALAQGAPIELTPQQLQAIEATRKLIAELPARSLATWEFIEGGFRHFPLPGEENAGYWWNLLGPPR
jgi:hypothetical protein